MFHLHLRNELWKLFGKKRTYIGFGAFVLAQLAMVLLFRFTRWQREMENLLAGNGYLAQEYISALTVAVGAFFGVGDANAGGNSPTIAQALAEYKVTLAAADVPAPPNFLAVSLTPSAHAGDALYLYAAWLLYTRKS